MAGEVERVISAGQAAWPGVQVDRARLEARLAARAQAEGASDAHDADLYLAVALAGNDPAALMMFEKHLVPEIDVALMRMRLPEATLDEVRQALRVEMLVADEGAPVIDSYLGLGPLANWLRVSATRRALKILRKTAREDSLDEVLVANWPDASANPERAELRRAYAGQLKQAIASAFAALTVRERNLLRQQLLDELTIDELALMYRAHRSTCARWLVDARAALTRGVQREMQKLSGASASELDSLLRFLDSDIELSISRILRDT